MKGAACLVLHGHLPWVLHHGRWPHGEDWLFEAVVETWLPLLDVLERCATRDVPAGWSVGMTPVLLEQLAHPRFRNENRKHICRCWDPIGEQRTRTQAISVTPVQKL